MTKKSSAEECLLTPDWSNKKETHEGDDLDTPKLRPVFAAFNMLVSTLCFATNFAFIKLMNRLEPEVSPFLLITMDGLVCVIFLTPIAMARTKKQSLKESLWAPFELLDWATIIFGFGHIVFIMLIIFVCMRSLPIVTVSIFLNMGPLLTVVLAVWILKEKPNIWSFVQVAVGFFGVILIVMGDVIERQENSMDDEV